MIEIIRNETTLMAYADGELDLALATALEKEMRRDPNLVSELVGFIRTRRIARAALMSTPETVGGRIPQALMENPHIAPARLHLHRGARGLLLAAGIAGAAFLGGAIFGQLQPRGALALLESTQMTRALNSTPSGSETELGGRTLRFVGTFQSPSSVCREAEISGKDDRTRAVMCRSAHGWAPALTVATRERGYEPSAGIAVIDDYLKGIGAKRVHEAAELPLLAGGN